MIELSSSRTGCICSCAKFLITSLVRVGFHPDFSTTTGYPAGYGRIDPAFGIDLPDLLQRLFDTVVLHTVWRILSTTDDR